MREWGKSVGYFTTVWKRQPDGGWKWVYDAGDALKQPRAEGGDIQPVASCTCNGAQSCRRPLASVRRQNAWLGPTFMAGRDRDNASFFVWLWNGRKYEHVIDDQFAAPPK